MEIKKKKLCYSELRSLSRFPIRQKTVKMSKFAVDKNEKIKIKNKHICFQEIQQCIFNFASTANQVRGLNKIIQSGRVPLVGSLSYLGGTPHSKF